MIIPPSIQYNVKTKLMIDLDEGTEAEDLKALFRLDDSTRRNITKVRVASTWEDIEEWVETNILWRLFDCLGELENLQKLHLYLGHGMDLPVAVLVNVMNQSPSLQMLCLDSLVLTGRSEKDFEMLAQAVRRHPSLTCACLSDIQVHKSLSSPHNQTTTPQVEAAFMEPFLVSLAQACSNMRVLELEGLRISPAALQAIASSPNLTDVEVWNIPEVGEHMETFASTLTNNTTTQKLELCDCGIQSGQHLTEMLLHNNTLTDVNLEIGWRANVMFGKPIASILKTNGTLTRLHLVCRQPDTTTHQGQEDCTAEAYADVICQSLAANTSLERLAIEFRQSRTSRNDNSRLSAAFTEPFQRALETNCILQEFALTGGRSIHPVTWRKDVEFYLKLNQAGRHEWLEQSHDDSFETLLQHKHDLSVSYYLLSLHTHLMINAAAL